MHGIMFQNLNLIKISFILKNVYVRESIKSSRMFHVLEIPFSFQIKRFEAKLCYFILLARPGF